MNDTTAPTGVIEHHDPHTLVIEDNVRPTAPITPAFVQSIRENGVLTPVLARRGSDGTVLVRAGQRRVYAAREAGLPTIPVYLVEADDVTAERIVQQMVENDQREALSDADRAAAFQQLAFEGLSVTAIARRTGTKTREVKTALAVTGNTTAATAIQEHALSLDQAAVLIEFEDDDTARADLIQVATTDPAQFAHAAQRARDEKTRNTIKAIAEAELSARGYEILENDPGYYDTQYIRLSELLSADGERVTVDLIKAVEGRAAYVRVYTDGEPSISYFVSDPTAAGFHRYDNGGSSNKGPMTDEQRAERRTLIANNKAWASAETVRREWLTTLLSRKTLPKDTAVVIATGLTLHRQAISTATRDGNELAHQLLGIETSGYFQADKLTALVQGSPSKALHVALAVVLGACESVTSKQSWRYPTTSDAAYLTQLAAWGYSLSDVEMIVTGTTQRNTTAGADDAESEPTNENEDQR
ncbi:ParB/RepB/Spo0J family partition protein [Leifsonia sp. 2MCAF36]|uniref:ParB/RepB/Spo0J family partition protein n=1 Tax=Leifsonia sp. 2MCAF36 TaxID=3232988 RepID=UPI003F9DCBA3